MHFTSTMKPESAKRDCKTLTTASKCPEINWHGTCFGPQAGRIELGGLEDQAKHLNERTARRP